MDQDQSSSSASREHRDRRATRPREPVPLPADQARRHAVEARRQAETLFEATRHISENLALDRAMRAIVEATRKLLGADRVAVFYLGSRTDQLACLASFGFSRTYLEGCIDFHASFPDTYPAFRSGQPVALENIARSTDPDHPRVRALLDEGARAALVIPLLRGGAVNGMLVLAHEYPRPYGPDEVEAAETLGRQAAIAIENARLYEDAETRAHELATINEATKRLAGAIDLESTLDCILEAAHRLSHRDLTIIALADPEAAPFRVAAARGAGAERLVGQVLSSAIGHRPVDDGSRIAAGDPPGREGVATREDNLSDDTLSTVGDTASTALESFTPSQVTRIEAGIWVPLSADGRVIGLLGAFSREPRSAPPISERVLVGLADHAALAIQRTRAEAALRETNTRLEAALAELQETQQRIVQQERLRALGEMASGIAHDFNNALQHVIGFCDLLLEVRPADLDDPTIVRNYLEWMRTAAHDAAETVRRLRGFYRHQDDGEPPRSVDLNDVVTKTVLLTQPRWRDQSLARGALITIRTRLDATARIRGKEAELREALTNLIFNAVDAMPNGGVIWLRSRTDGDAVILEVEDSGMGMTAEVRKRCLEPFFTTKGPEGSGLGLAMVYGTVERHGGALDLESDVGQGTRVRLRLPAERRDAGAASDVSGPEPSGPLNLLFVEDDLAVRRIVYDMIQSLGHSVSAVSSGADALDALAHEHFDLVVTDRAMAGMSGDELARAVKAANPALPVLMLTGFGELMRASGELPSGVDLVLGKPITRDDLRRAIATIHGKLA